MGTLLEGLPCAVTVGGIEYAIATDHITWMRVERLLADPEPTPAQRLGLLLARYQDEVPPDIRGAIKALLWFFRCGQPEQKARQEAAGTGKAPARVLDFDQDAPLICAAFRQAYGIDLCHEELHWWQFHALLEGLPEQTRLSQVMAIRAADLARLPKAERERYRRLQQLYALGDAPEQAPKTMAERNELLLAKARQAKERAQR